MSATGTKPKLPGTLNYFYRTRRRMYVLLNRERARSARLRFTGPDADTVMGVPYMSFVVQADTPIRALRRFREVMADYLRGADQVAWHVGAHFDDSAGREGVFRIVARLAVWQGGNQTGRGGGIDIGDFRIEPTRYGTPGKVWIRRISGDAAGEGGEFDIAALEETIREFYEARF